MDDATIRRALTAAGSPNVKAFQRAKKLKVDGVVGPITEAALQAVLAGSDTSPVTPVPAAAHPASVYVGLDTFAYPGDAAMAYLKAHSNVSWVGFYLAPAPSHPNTSWMTTRARLVAAGFGIAPVYLGQEVTGPGSHHTDAAHGVTDGADAVALMAKAGFPKGSCVYLDLENGAPLSALQRAYVIAWAGEVTKRGYLPGVYCSYQMGAAVHAAVPGARIWVFHVKTTASHAVAGPSYPAPSPIASGYAGAVLWQLDDEARIVIAGNGARLSVDLDTSTMPDPSAPAPVAVAA